MVKEKYEVYHKAFKEFREIIKFFPKNEYKKIPKVFIDFIEENMDKNYEYIVEHVDDFQNQEMLEETKVLLSIVYRDFLTSSQERKQIIKMENDELWQEEKIIQEKYNPDNLFKNKNTSIIENTEENSNIDLIEVKEKNFLQKILDKIKNLFSKDKVKFWTSMKKLGLLLEKRSPIIMLKI